MQREERLRVSSVHGKPLLPLGFLHFALVFEITLAGGTMFLSRIMNKCLFGTSGFGTENSNEESDRDLRGILAGGDHGRGAARTIGTRNAPHAPGHGTRRLHAGRHASRDGERREAGSENGRSNAHDYAARWTDDASGAYEPHENAAAARSDLDNSRGRLAARLHAEAGGFQRKRSAWAGAAPRGLLERKPLRLSLSK